MSSPDHVPGSKPAGRQAVSDPGGPRTPMRKQVVSLVLLPVLLGLVAGVLVSAAAWVFEDLALNSLVQSTSIWIGLVPFAALPLSGLALWFVAGTFWPSTNELYILNANTPEKRMPVGEIPGRVLAGGVTAGCGGAQGLESPSASIGSAVGTVLEQRAGRWIPSQHHGFLMMSGASAGIAAIFSSPAVGALYGLEVPYRRGLDPRPILPAAIAAGVAVLVRWLMVGLDPLIPQAGGGVRLDWTVVLLGLLLAVVCGLGARLFAVGANTARSLRRRTSPIRSALIGSFLLVGIAYLGWSVSSQWVTLGPGHAMFDWATHESRAIHLLLIVLVIHALATMTCVFGGGGGGVFTSLAATGALLGCSADLVPGVSAPEYFLPMIGAACLLSAAYRIPIAGWLMIVEWGGGLEAMLLGAVCVWVSKLCVGSITIAPAQAPRYERAPQVV